MTDQQRRLFTIEEVKAALGRYAHPTADPMGEDMTVEFAIQLAEKDAEIARLRSELARKDEALLAFRAASAKAMCCLAFFASATRSGDQWSDTCEAEFNAVKTSYAALSAG